MISCVLLIDDDKDDRELFSEAVASIDKRIICICCEKAEDAIRILEKKELKIPEVIFLDINLPEMSGWQCLTYLKSSPALKQIPVIMYSTSSHLRDKQIAKDLGAARFITKPDNFLNLKSTLNSLLIYGLTMKSD